MNVISTLCPSLDTLLDGGIERKTITQIYGESATGKTNICLQIAKSVLINNKKVIYIDTESGLSIVRLYQVFSNSFDSFMENMIIIELDVFESLCNTVQSLKKIVDERFDLIIVDSIASLYRLECTSLEERLLMGKELAKILAVLTGIAKHKNIAVVVTNQVYEDINTNTLEPIGGASIKYWSKNIIELLKSKDCTTRTAKLIRHRFLAPNASIVFKITERGIESER